MSNQELDDERSGMRWIESAGGPMVVVPTSALSVWGGVPDDFDDHDLTDWGDYGRACSVEDYAGVIPVGDAEALVLGDEPAATTYISEQRLFVRWVCADADADIIRLVPKALDDAVWEDAGTWTTDGPAELFDSVLAGDELGPDDRLSISVEPDTYRV